MTFYTDLFLAMSPHLLGL